MSELHRFTRVEFSRFKAFKRFTLHLRHFNILVGPNNAGKSTVLAAFRMLAASLRKATQRKPERVGGPEGVVPGYQVDLTEISVAEENIFFNYDDEQPASVKFVLSSKRALTLHFPAAGVCHLIPSDPDQDVPLAPSTFRKRFNCRIGFVPVLGPVEHNERLYENEAARRALFNYRAARNFRNIWHHFPERFEEFRNLLLQTWPGMDVERPVVTMGEAKPVLHMFCPEARIPREIFWSGFGFQVWCQMLTHLVQAVDCSIFLIDEPDIYLHSDLQRQLLGLLKGLGPDVVLATHSTEIITESEPDDIVLVSKDRKTARRLKSAAELAPVFTTLGSNLNPTLTQLAKSRRALFLEGKDFQILGRFARKLGHPNLANRTKFADVPVGGFNPARIRDLKNGIETALGTNIGAFIVLDRDYRSLQECSEIEAACGEFSSDVVVHPCKELENFLLVASAMDLAVQRRVAERAARGGKSVEYEASADRFLTEYAASQRSHILSQLLACRRKFARHSKTTTGLDEATVDKKAVEEFEVAWGDPLKRLEMIPGKDALAAFNAHLQQKYGVTVSASGIIDAMKTNDVPDGIRSLIERLHAFTKASPG